VTEVATALLAGEPPIYLVPEPGLRQLTVNPVSLQEGEVEIVAPRLLEELTAEPAR
jgi:hypothetical protein